MDDEVGGSTSYCTSIKNAPHIGTHTKSNSLVQKGKGLLIPKLIGIMGESEVGT